jgi:hypothetical protein
MSTIKDAIKKLSSAVKAGDLSTEEEAVALKMIILLQKQQASRSVARIQYAKQKEYYLRYTQHCICCDSFIIRWYWMSDTGLGYLKSNPCSPISEEIKHKKKGDKIYSCPLCREVLLTKTVEELTERLIKSYIDRRKIK